MADHPTAAAIRSIFKISGITVLLSIFLSLFNVNAAAALTGYNVKFHIFFRTPYSISIIPIQILRLNTKA